MVDKVLNLVENFDKVAKLREENIDLQEQLLKLSYENYKVLCAGILNLYWYAMQGDTENFNHLFETMVRIATEGLE